MTSNVNGVTGGSSAATTNSNGNTVVSSDKALNELNFNTFLTLLTTQLKNQDPLNPMDETQFTGELAQFGSLNQQIQTNTLLGQLTQQNNYGQQALATSYMGRAVLAPGTTLSMNGGSVPFGYSLEDPAAELQVQIYDPSTGAIVKTLMPTGTDALSEGPHDLTWDGTDDQGNAVASGNYQVKLTAFDSNGEVVTSKLLTYGVVVAVDNNSDGSTSLELGDNRKIAFTDVQRVVMVANSVGDSGASGGGDSGTDSATN
jgi:flagellar basal-body rod modification protein FlgD